MKKCSELILFLSGIFSALLSPRKRVQATPPPAEQPETTTTRPRGKTVGSPEEARRASEVMKTLEFKVWNPIRNTCRTMKMKMTRWTCPYHRDFLRYLKEINIKFALVLCFQQG